MPVLHVEIFFAPSSRSRASQGEESFCFSLSIRVFVALLPAWLWQQRFRLQLRRKTAGRKE